jgi:hypothetical protein
MFGFGKKKNDAQERSAAAEIARHEKPERETEEQHQRIVDRNLRVDDGDEGRACGKQEERHFSAEVVRGIGGRQIPGERADDHHEGIHARIQYRQLPFGFEKRR